MVFIFEGENWMKLKNVMNCLFGMVVVFGIVLLVNVNVSGFEGFLKGYFGDLIGDYLFGLSSYSGRDLCLFRLVVMVGVGVGVIIYFCCWFVKNDLVYFNLFYYYL